VTSFLARARVMARARIRVKVTACHVIKFQVTSMEEIFKINLILNLSKLL